MTDSSQTLAPATVLRARAGASVFLNSAEELQIVLPNSTATFRSARAVAAVGALLDRLPADRDFLVAGAAADAGLEPGFVGSCLDMLTETGCVFPCASDGLSTGSPEIDEYYASVGVDPGRVATSLASVRVVAVTEAARQEVLASLFARAGLPVAVTALAGGAACADALEAVREATANGATLLSIWNLPYRSPIAQQLNELAIQRGMPALFGACEGVVARTGRRVAGALSRPEGNEGDGARD